MDAGQNRLVKGGCPRRGGRTTCARKETRKRQSAITGRIQRHRGSGRKMQWVLNTEVIEEIRSHTSVPAVWHAGSGKLRTNVFQTGGRENGNSIQAFQAVVRTVSTLAVEDGPRSRIGRNGENLAA